MTAARLHVALAVVLFAAAACSALLALHWHRHPRTPGRHQREARACKCCDVTGYDGPQDRDDGYCPGCGHRLLSHFQPHEPLPPERSREELGFTAELRGLPAPGKDMYSDRTVVLPRTPPYPKEVMHDAGLLPERSRRELPTQRVTGASPEAPQRTLWQPAWPPAPLHEAAAERHASDTDVRAVACAAPARPATMLQPVTFSDYDAVHAITGHVVTSVPARLDGRCRCGLPEGHFADALLNAPLGSVAAAFDTASFPAVTG